jgi:membrane-associated phospholipid phosphatase
MSRRAALLLLAAAAAIAGAHLADPFAYATLVDKAVYEHDDGRLLRVMGYAPTWLAVAAALWLADPRPAAHGGTVGRWRALALLASVAVAGIGAELLKLAFRRERPEPNAGAYVFRPFDEKPFSTSGLALPSSHTMVAFGACVLLGFLFPRARWVFWLLAAGCGVTRVLARAHFVSDVVAAAAAAAAGAALVWRWLGPRTAAATGAA